MLCIGAFKTSTSLLLLPAALHALGSDLPPDTEGDVLLVTRSAATSRLGAWDSRDSRPRLSKPPCQRVVCQGDLRRGDSRDSLRPGPVPRPQDGLRGRACAETAAFGSFGLAALSCAWDRRLGPEAEVLMYLQGRRRRFARFWSPL
mmetsp:Transcript_70790/g.112179  ORF Transcript_70790/g.112179 Transcript_70790/m.112179 type:complete len:146 (+) Transcript_70790:143-580(+)